MIPTTLPQNNINPYMSNSTPAALPPPERVAAPADKVSVETPKKSPAERAEGLGKVLSKTVQQGLSYANARRARETYKPVSVPE